MKEKRTGGALRRTLALGVGVAVFWGLASAGGGIRLPTPWKSGDGSALAQALVETEVGAFDGAEDEPSLWTQLVTSELPLSASEDRAEEEAAQTELAALEADADFSAPAGDPLAEQADAAASEEATASEEQEAAPETPVDDGGAVRETITANSNTVSGGGVEVNNNTQGITVDPAALASSVLTQTIAPASQGPQILIMHTHGSEAYTMVGDDIYTETDTSRTDDPNYNMIRVGEEMKAVFESMGFSVIHDTSLYDYPNYTGSYTRSLAGIQSILEQYPTISVVLDVHRDALIASDGTVYKAVTQVNGEDVAQVMLVVGTNDGGLTHPGWQDNLNLAAHIQLGMTAMEPTLARPINLRSQRFNQHLTPCSLLVEVGTSGNTLQEALRGARYFAQAAGAVYQGLVTG